MKCPHCKIETLGVNRNNRNVACDSCGGVLPLSEPETPLIVSLAPPQDSEKEPEKPKPRRKRKAAAK